MDPELERKAPPPGPPTRIAPPENVNIARTDQTLTVTPDRARIKPEGRVHWIIAPDVIPRGGSLVIDFDSEEGIKGPFRKGNDPDNPRRGEYRKAHGQTLSILTDRADRKDYWKYSVSVLAAGGLPDCPALDPGVDIKE